MGFFSVSSSAPVARAAPSAQAMTRASSASSPSIVSLLTKNHAEALSGMMLGASPPSVMTPCTRSPGGSCWRSRETALNVAMRASSALTPCSGAAEAWAARPLKWKRSSESARKSTSTLVSSDGCIIMAAPVSRNMPVCAISTLPPPPSSPGVPKTVTPPYSEPSASLSATPAAAPATPMTLWAQACPRPGSASYSERKDTDGFFSSTAGLSARNAVGRFATPRVRVNPLFSR